MNLSIRNQLILLNVGVVAVSSLLLGTVLVLEIQRRGYERIDAELQDRVRPFVESRRDNGDRGPFGQDPGPPPGDRPVENGGGGPNRENRPPPHSGPDDPFFAFRRALMISADGKVVAPRDATTAYDAESARRALTESLVWSTIPYGEDHIRVLSVRSHDPDQKTMVVQVARDLRDVDGFENSLRQTFFWGVPMVLLFAAGGALFLVSRAMKPVDRVSKEAERISADNLSQRLTVSHQDEIGRLALAFNALIARLEAAFDRQRQFTADASHELRTPLTRLKLATSSGREAATADEMRQALVVADQAASAMDRLVKQLLVLSRVDATGLPIHGESVDLRVVVAEALMMVADADRIDVEMPDEPLLMVADSDVVRRVTINLAENALKYAPAPAAIHLSVDAHRVTVRDSGPGISPEDLSRLGERFFRVDSARSAGGVGLGLSITKALLEAHGGYLEVQSEVGVGSVFIAHIPPLPVEK